ncbi:MAG: gamma-glutamyltransferase [Gemmatimonadota bacterium]
MTPTRNSRPALRTLQIALLGTLVACAPSAPPTSTLAPDLGKRVVAANGVVAAAHPLASEAGLSVLRQGGNAIDAAVATAFAIGVVEPQMSGVGGSGAMLVWRAGEERAEFLDFYASQPVTAFRAAGVSGRDSTAPLLVVGVPGSVAGLLLTQERFGRLTRGQVLAPAISIAEDGFPMYPVLAYMIGRDSVRLARDTAARAQYLPNGRKLGIGEHFRNAPLARVLRAIAADGRKGFYEGWVARDVVARMNQGGHPVRLADFTAYEPVWRRPLCTTRSGRVLLSAPPPEGGMQVLHTLNLVDPGQLRSLGLYTQDARAFDLITSALRVGQTASRASGDPRWRAIPARGIVSQQFATKRRGEVATGRVADSIQAVDAREFDAGASPDACVPFEPYAAAPPVPATTSGSDAASESDGRTGGETTHISVVDREGNAVAVTVTNSSTFGAGVAVNGFFLNNSGGLITKAELERANAPAWLTRQTTIAPTLVMHNKSVEMVIGSPGGGRIPLAMAQTLINVLDYGQDPLEAVRMPRISPSAANKVVEIEGGFDPPVLSATRAMGYDLRATSFEYARIYMIARRGAAWIGVADPRHDGQVRGY